MRIKKKTNDTPPKKCPLCCLEFICESSLKDHMKESCVETSSIIKDSPRESNVKEHLDTIDIKCHENLPSDEDFLDKLYPCSHCDTSFTTKCDLDTHKILHCDENLSSGDEKSEAKINLYCDESSLSSDDSGVKPEDAKVLPDPEEKLESIIKIE